MTTALASPPIDSIREFDNEQLVSRLKDLLRLTIENVIEMAGIVRVLSERGYDLATLRLGIIRHLQLISFGKLLPEVLVRYQANPMLLGRLESLPPAEQQRLIDACRVEVAKDDDATALVYLDALGRDEIYRVFGPQGVRSAKDQIEYLRLDASRPAETGKKTGVKIDTKKGGIEVNGLFLSRRDLTQYLLYLEKHK